MTSHTYTAVHLTDQLPATAADTIVSRTLYKDGLLRVILFGFAPGQELSEHTSSHAAILQILAGEADLTLGEDRLQAGPGTWVRMDPHLPHSVLAKTALTLLLTMIESPAP